MSPPTLQSIAREKNWIEFAVLLEMAMAEPGRYGLADASAVRATVARLRRQLPSSLVGALKAVRYLRARRPDLLARREARVGCVQVRLLERIADVCPGTAAAIEAGVFDGAVRAAELRARYATLVDQAPAKARVAPTAEAARPRVDIRPDLRPEARGRERPEAERRDHAAGAPARRIA